MPVLYLSTLSKDELRALVSEWTLMLKSDGLTPEKTLVRVKTLVREVVEPLVASYASTAITDDRTAFLADASQWCIRAYFDDAPGRGGRAGSGAVGNPVARKSLSRRLLLKLLVLRPELSSVALASRLSVDRPQLAAFASGTQLMPLDVQERLATYVIEDEAALARLARQLRLQVKAARRYAEGHVVQHQASPPRMW